MGKGKLSQKVVRKRAVDKAAEWLASIGAPVEQVTEVKEATLDKAPESRLDKLREAQSVILYFDTLGEGFKEKQCKNCKQMFAYKWELSNIAFCSVNCAAEDLRQIGIKWDPDKPQSQRWGHHAPAVVPPIALEILKHQLLDFQEDPLSDTDPSTNQ
jgi:hypothetical protein